VSGGASPDGTVRPAARADAGAIAAVHVAAWQHAYAGLLDAEFLAGLDVAQRAQRWHERLTEPAEGVFVLVFEQLGQVSGFVSAGPSQDDDRDGGEVYAIYVDPRGQRRGTGSALLTAAARRLAEAAFTEATLWVLDGNAPARRFYEAHGWRTDGKLQAFSYGDGDSATKVRYSTRLPAPADPG
jgi:ribosomal protein S18 acetylase RimI-like enzyme